MKNRWRRWAFLAVVTVVGFLADWGTKKLVLDSIPQGAFRPVAGDWLAWTLVYNPGSLFSLNPANWIPGFPVVGFYIVFNIIAMLFLVWFYARLDPVRNRVSVWGVALLLPGALGNFLDRAVGRPGVVDFIRVDLGFPPMNPWPTFNVADAFITVGIVLVMLDMVAADVGKWRERRAQKA